MKCYALLAASALAVTSAQQPCDTTKLLAIVTGTNGAGCSAATGYTPTTLSIPSGDELKKVCLIDSCKALLQEITAAVPTECTFNGKPIKSTLIDPFPAACAAAMGSPTTAPTPTTTAPGATTTMPMTTTPAPSASSQAPTTPAPTAATEPPMTSTMMPEPTAMGEMSSSGSDGGSSSSSGSGSEGDAGVGMTDEPSGDVPAPASSAPKLTAIVGVVVALVVSAMM